MKNTFGIILYFTELCVTLHNNSQNVQSGTLAN